MSANENHTEVQDIIKGSIRDILVILEPLSDWQKSHTLDCVNEELTEIKSVYSHADT